MSRILISHRKSSRRTLVGSVVSIVAMGPFLATVAYFFEFSGIPAAICVALFIFNLIGFGYVIWATARNPAGFVCELTETDISCKNPVRFMGDSFSIPISEIDEIHVDSAGEGHPKYRLTTKDGKNYWLTCNFGNPAGRILDELRKLRPDARYVDGFANRLMDDE